MCYKQYSSYPLIRTLLSDQISDTNKVFPSRETNPLIRQIVHCGSGELIFVNKINNMATQSWKKILAFAS